MYKGTVIINDYPFKSNANPILVPISDQVQSHFTFNYYFIYENILARHMKAVMTVYDLLSIPSDQYLFLADIKYGYWVVNVYSNDWHYLIFHMLSICQILSICILQRARTSFFTFSKLINFVFWLILLLQPELSLLYGNTAKNTLSLVFYMDDIYGAFKTHQKQYIFLCKQFFQCMV